MPNAMPLTTVAPALASAPAISVVILRPYFVARRGAHHDRAVDPVRHATMAAWAAAEDREAARDSARRQSRRSATADGVNQGSGTESSRLTVAFLNSNRRDHHAAISGSNPVRP